MIIIPLAKLVLKSFWFWVPVFFWMIASMYGLGFTFKGIGMAAGLSVAWFFAVYAIFGTALEEEIDKHDF